jgi:hypothetical protein
MALDPCSGSLARLRRLQLLCSTDSADDRLPDALLFIAGIDSRNNAGSQVHINKRDMPECATVCMESGEESGESPQLRLYLQYLPSY